MSVFEELKTKLEDEFEKLKEELAHLVGINDRSELHAKVNATLDNLHDHIYDAEAATQASEPVQPSAPQPPQVPEPPAAAVAPGTADAPAAGSDTAAVPPAGTAS